MTPRLAPVNHNGEFLFLANQLALDFLNTCPVQDGQSVELLPDFPALCRWFAAAGLISAQQAMQLASRWTGSRAAQNTMHSMVRFREMFRKELPGWLRGASIRRSTASRLNRLLAEHPMHTRLVTKDRAVRRASWFEARRPDDLFAPLAESACSLLASADRARVRRCANCVLYFLDTSKKGNRRWCSMQLCGNRLKVAAYAARHRHGRAD